MKRERPEAHALVVLLRQADKVKVTARRRTQSISPVTFARAIGTPSLQPTHHTPEGIQPFAKLTKAGHRRYTGLLIFGPKVLKRDAELLIWRELLLQLHEI